MRHRHRPALLGIIVIEKSSVAYISGMGLSVGDILREGHHVDVTAVVLLACCCLLPVHRLVSVVSNGDGVTL